jgi:hypothetical protein
MRRPPAWWIAWGLCAAFAVVAAGTVAIDASANPPSEPSESFWNDLGLLLVFAAFVVVGALVASRQPRNAVGWLFIAAPMFAMVGAFSEEYAFRAFIVDDGDLPLALFFAWLASWTWFPALGAIGLIPLLFPDGRLPGPRWRPVLWAFVGIIALTAVGAAVSPGPMFQDQPGSPDKPLTVEGLDGFLAVAEPVAAVVGLLLLVALLASVVVRFRRSRGDERQQLKWMLVAFALLVGQILVVEALPGEPPDAVANAGFALGVAAIPVAAGIAMLRYRLYDVDVVIRKTLVYGSLSVLLGLAYVALVLAGQAVFSSVAGGGDLAIAVSTLVVAALFLPVRSRVQRLVDRRFYRRRYDAQRTLEAFGAQVRREVELEELRVALCRVVAATVEPASTSVWLRGRGEPS